MSGKAAAAAQAAAAIRQKMASQERTERFARLASRVRAYPRVGAGIVTGLAGLGLAFAPALRHTRAGLLEGLGADVADVVPGSESTREAVLRGAGCVFGGSAGAHVSWQLIHMATVHWGATGGYARVPIAAMGGIASAFVGMELAEPAATLGTKLGRTAALGAEGLGMDVHALLDWKGGSSSSRDRGEGEGGVRSGDGRSDRGGEGGVRSGDPSRASFGGTETETETESERAAAGRVDATNQDALARALVRLRRAEATARLERGKIASSHRRRELDAKLRDIRGAKGDLKARCKEEHGVSLGRVIAGDIRRRAAALTDARARQLALRLEADAAHDKRERRRLHREIRGLDAIKRSLKADAKAAYGVKLSKHAPEMEKR